jgi:hypothetical protein
MDKGLPKSILIAAGVILVAGGLLVALQYSGQLSGGVSADVAEQELPAGLMVSRDDYRTVLRLIQEYDTKTDLARKNQVFRELSVLILSWKEGSGIEAE